MGKKRLYVPVSRNHGTAHGTVTARVHHVGQIWNTGSGIAYSLSGAGVPQFVPLQSVTSSEVTMSAKVSFQWYYVRLGIEKKNRKTVSLYMRHENLSMLVDQIVQYVRDESRPGEKCSSRLEITDNRNCDVLYDLPCPIRVMNKVKKKFQYING